MSRERRWTSRGGPRFAEGRCGGPQCIVQRREGITLTKSSVAAEGGLKKKRGRRREAGRMRAPSDVHDARRPFVLPALRGRQLFALLQSSGLPLFSFRRRSASSMTSLSIEPREFDVSARFWIISL